MNKIILEVVVGSTVHGIAVQDGLEDLDLMAVILEDKTEFVGFHDTDTWTARTKPEGVRSEAGDVDWVGYGLRKYLHLALKGNPSVLLSLFAPTEYMRTITPEGESLRAMVPHIVSQRCYPRFRGYMRQQHERLLGLRGQRNGTRPELVDAYGYDTKYAAHIVRLGLQGAELLRSGHISLPMPEDARELCIKVRTGGFSLAEVSMHIIDAERRLDDAFVASPLAESPDVAQVEAWMIDTYLAHWQRNEYAALR